MPLYALSLGFGSLQLEQLDPKSIAAIIVVLLILLVVVAGGSSTTTPAENTSTPANTASPPPTGRQAIEPALRIIQGMTGQMRYDTLEDLFAQLPTPLPEDLIPALLEGTNHQIRVKAIHLLRPKCPRNISLSIQERIADPSLLSETERAQIVNLLNH